MEWLTVKNGVVWAFRSEEQREIEEDERKDFGCG